MEHRSSASDLAAVVKDIDPLTRRRVLAMSVEDLRTELQKRNLFPASTTRSDLMDALISAIEPKSVTPRTTKSESDKVFTESTKPTELQLELKRLEMEQRKLEAEERRAQREADAEERRFQREFEEKKLQEKRRQDELQFEAEERQRKHEFAMKQLDVSAQTAPALAPVTPVFRTDTAVKLIPKFKENDIESFLHSFEKIAELNSFPEDKYSAILQAHLTG